MCNERTNGRSGVNSFFSVWLKDATYVGRYSQATWCTCLVLRGHEIVVIPWRGWWKAD